MTATNKLELELLQNAAANQTLANTTFARLNQLVQAGVVDKDLAAPPASPADESLYIVGAAATGVWAGRDGQLAYWLVTAGAWQFVAPREGFFLHVNDEDAFYKFTGTAWEVFSGGGGGGGMTNPMTSIRDLIVGGVGGAPARLPGPTSEGLVLTRIGNALAWAIATGFANPMTAAGDIIFGGANGAATRLGAGTAGQVLTIVAGAPAWVTPSGGGGGTGDFKKDGSVQMTAALNEAPAHSVVMTSDSENIPASAIAAANTIKVSGGPSVRYLDYGNSSKLGSKRTLIFGDAMTLYHSLDYLILPGAANITTAIGDSAEFFCEGPSPRLWRCLRYNRADGKALYSSSVFTEAQVRNTPLTGLPATTGDVTETDTVLSGIGKLQASKVDKSTAVTSVAGRTGTVTLTKSDVGLANADNTADSAKPVSVAQQAALDGKVSLTGNESIAGNKTFTSPLSVTVETGSSELANAVFNDSSSAIPSITCKKSRGSVASPAALMAQDRLGSIIFQGRNASLTYSSLAALSTFAAADFTASSTSTYSTFENTVTGSLSRATVFTINESNNFLLNVGRGAASGAKLDVGGSTTISGPLRVGVYTLSTLPSASASTNHMIVVSNASNGPKVCLSNGTVWQILNTTTTVS